MTRCRLLMLICSILYSTLGLASVDFAGDEDAIAIVESDFAYLASLKFQSASPAFITIFQGSKSENAIQLFKSHVKKISWDATMTNVYSLFWGRGEAQGELVIGPLLMDSSNHWVFRTSAYLHEAMHTQKENHIECRGNIMINNVLFELKDQQGKWVCDKTDTSPLAAQYVFLRMISEYCTNCNRETKYLSKIIANAMILPRIEDPSVRRKLIDESNPNPHAAEVEAAKILSNRFSSNLNYAQWFSQCTKNESCF